MFCVMAINSKKKAMNMAMKAVMATKIANTMFRASTDSTTSFDWTITSVLESKFLTPLVIYSYFAGVISGFSLIISTALGTLSVQV